MKKQFLNLGKALNKAEQREIFGGAGTCDDECSPSVGGSCPSGQECVEFNSNISCPDDPQQFICMPSAYQ
ncbi:hypothetical protein [Lutibacter sp.]|uniref:hypothetical protein n=1 Tax=Lutibacter sp. TaxID=1925666 RepID=UPI0025C54BA9|nr:hypothetical protein [Lutibacter sp.]MCF6168849.1 hypothetical protein [Lutibacter sp.]